jgi:hypothetical protein
MITAEVIRYLNTITEFKEDELQIIEPFLQDKTMQKGEPLLEEGQICDDIYLVLSGVLRNYYNNNGTDVNLSFTFANQCTTNFEAYINREPSKIIIEALEKSRIVVIKSKLLRRQNKSIDSVATFIRTGHPHIVGYRRTSQYDDDETALRSLSICFAKETGADPKGFTYPLIILPRNEPGNPQPDTQQQVLISFFDKYHSSNAVMWLILHLQ